MKNSIIIVILIVVLAISLVVLIRGHTQIKTYTIQQINSPAQVKLPIDNENEAVQYSLSLEQVRIELNKPLEGRIAKYNKYDWWAKAFNEYEYSNKNEKYKGYNYWIVNWFKGPSECESPHGCQIIINPDGTVKSNLKCSDGWWCG